MKYIKRYLENEIQKIQRTFKVLYLGGPRQVGKTTLLLHLAKSLKIGYVTLDDSSLRKLAKEDPELFLEEYSSPLFIDEVQYAPELFPYIKMRVDESEKTGQYWLTGSQHFALMRNLQESLVGRVGIVHLLGLSFSEIHNIPRAARPFSFIKQKKDFSSLSSSQIFEHIFRGSFPALWKDKNLDTEIFYNSYLQTYIDRDLREIFGISKISQFHTFVQLCAARTGQVLNFSEIARDASIAPSTAQEWLSILESTSQVYLLRSYHNNISKRLIKSPKLYFLDTGLAAYLTRWKSPQTLRAGAMAGAFFETFIVSEVVKSFLFRGEEPPLYYFRDKEGHEVDLLIEEERILYPVEVKLASLIKSEDARNIQFLRKKISTLGHGTIISLTPTSRPLDRETTILPAHSIQ